MAGYTNGRIPGTALTAIPGSARLLAPVAVVWLAICAEVHRLHGWTPAPTGPDDAYRAYAVQEAIFRARYTTTVLAGRPYKVWNGVRWYQRPGTATAAVPGTSNHGLGCAVDVTGLGGFDGLRYDQFAAVAARHGWTNTEGRSIGEPWHWVDVGTANLVAKGLYEVPAISTVPTLTAPTPLTPLIPEDDMAFTATSSTGQNWLIAGVFRRPITEHERDELSVLAAPATVPWLQGISDDALAAYADISGGQLALVADGD